MRPLALAEVTASTRCTDRARPFDLNQTVYRVINNPGILGLLRRNRWRQSRPRNRHNAARTAALACSTSSLVTASLASGIVRPDTLATHRTASFDEAVRPVASRLGPRASTARRGKPLRKRNATTKGRRGRPWRLLRVWGSIESHPCACRKSNSHVQMVKSAEKWRRQNATDGMCCSRRRRVFVDRKVRASLVIQRGLRTPTGPFFARFFIGIILGLVAEFAFMVPLTRMVLSSSAARWKSRKQIGGLKCRPGCSTGRHALTSGFWQFNRM